MTLKLKLSSFALLLTAIFTNQNMNAAVTNGSDKRITLSKSDFEKLKAELKKEILQDLNKSRHNVIVRGKEEKIASPLGSVRVTDAETATQEKKNWPKKTEDEKGAVVTKPGFIPVPGTNTYIRLYGYADMKIAATRHEKASGYTSSISMFPDHISYDGIGNEQETEYNFIATDSRFGIETFSLATFNDKEYPLKVLLEFDLSGGGNGSTTINSTYQLKIRHAYMGFGPFILGMTTSAFVDPFASGEIFGPGITGSTTKRMPQIRYVKSVNDKLELRFALERTATDYWYASKPGTKDTTITHKNTFSPWKKEADNQYHSADVLPAGVIALTYKTDKGHFGFGALARYLRLSSNLSETRDGQTIKNARSESKFGYGARISGSYKISDKDTIFGSATIGDAIGLYISDTRGYSIFVDHKSDDFSDFKLKSQSAFGAVAGIRHIWSKKYNLRSTVTAGYTHIGICDAFKQAIALSKNHLEVTRKLFSVVGNIAMNPFPKLVLALEYGYGKKSLLDRRSANCQYFLFDTRLSF